MGDHHARCFSIEFTTVFTANHGVCKNVLIVTPTATAANSPARTQTRRVCHLRPFSCAQTARPTCQSHLFPSTRLALSRLRAVCSPCRLCWLRARTVPEGWRARDSFPDGPTTTPHIESTLSSLPCHLPPCHPAFARATGYAHCSDVYPQWNSQLADSLTGSLCTCTCRTPPCGGCFPRGRLVAAPGLFFCDRRAFLSRPAASAVKAQRPTHHAETVSTKQTLRLPRRHPCLETTENQGACYLPQEGVGPLCEWSSGDYTVLFSRFVICFWKYAGSVADRYRLQLSFREPGRRTVSIHQTQRLRYVAGTACPIAST